MDSTGLAFLADLDLRGDKNGISSGPYDRLVLSFAYSRYHEIWKQHQEAPE